MTTLVDQAHRAIQASAASPSRLVLLVGPGGSGKTRLLRTLQADRGYPYFSLGPALAERLRAEDRRRRPLKASRLAAEILDEFEDDVILLDNIELLFLPELRLDPLRVLESLSRNRTLCVAWEGRSGDDGSLSYADHGHPEYTRYPQVRAEVITMPGTM